MTHVPRDPEEAIFANPERPPAELQRERLDAIFEADTQRFEEVGTLDKIRDQVRGAYLTTHEALNPYNGLGKDTDFGELPTDTLELKREFRVAPSGEHVAWPVFRFKRIVTKPIGSQHPVWSQPVELYKSVDEREMPILTDGFEFDDAIATQLAFDSRAEAINHGIVPDLDSANLFTLIPKAEPIQITGETPEPATAKRTLGQRIGGMLQLKKEK